MGAGGGLMKPLAEGGIRQAGVCSGCYRGPEDQPSVAWGLQDSSQGTGEAAGTAALAPFHPMASLQLPKDLLGLLGPRIPKGSGSGWARLWPELFSSHLTCQTGLVLPRSWGREGLPLSFPQHPIITASVMITLLASSNGFRVHIEMEPYSPNTIMVTISILLETLPNTSKSSPEKH